MHHPLSGPAPSGNRPALPHAAFPWALVIMLLIPLLGNADALAQVEYQDEKGIKPWSENSWFWSYHDQPVVLIGGSDDDNLFQWPAEKLIPQLDRIAAAGGNVVRNTMSDRKDGNWEVYAFAEIEPGKYDLTKWNDEYWRRFDRFLQETGRRQIFVQLELWDRFDYTDNRANDAQRWEKHPYNPVNNINYTEAETGLKLRYPKHPGANDQPFFFSTPQQKNIQPLLKIQQAYVDQLLSISLRYDHILYCIDNETSGQAEWGEYWAQWIHKKAQQQNRRVSVTEMWDDWDLRSGQHRNTFDHPETYDFVDVSQNNHNKGQKHWDNFQFVRQQLSEHPRPINTTKIYGADGNRFGHSDQDAIERFWRHLLGGAASVRFHRPDSGLGINDKAVACLRSAQRLQAGVPFWNLEPANNRLTRRSDNECYAAATRNDSTLVLYFPPGKDREVLWQPKDAASTHRWNILWLDVDHAGRQQGQEIEGNRFQPPPEMGNVVALIKRTDAPLLSGRIMEIQGQRAFVMFPRNRDPQRPQRWVLYGPTLLPNYPDEHERWMHQQLLDAGLAIAGIDVGEAYGSPSSIEAQEALYQHLTEKENFDPRPVVLGRSRGGLWASSWGIQHADRLRGLAGIYPVFDLRSYPGINNAAGAYQMSAEQLQAQLGQLNPIARASKLAEAQVPVFIIHGQDDTVVPPAANSQALETIYRKADQADLFELQLIPGQGHNYWPGFFRSQKLVDFIIRQSTQTER